VKSNFSNGGPSFLSYGERGPGSLPHAVVGGAPPGAYEPTGHNKALDLLDL
jgi:hypothetical protein